MHEGLPTGWRIVVVASTAAVILLLLVLIGYFTDRWNNAQAQPLPPSKYDQRIVALDRQAIEQAYLDQVQHLFATWMKSPEGQPARALIGTNNARRAFIAAMDEIDKREQAK